MNGIVYAPCPSCQGKGSVPWRGTEFNPFDQTNSSALQVECYVMCERCRGSGRGQIMARIEEGYVGFQEMR